MTKAALIGTWRPTSLSFLHLDTNETSRPYGDDLTGYLQYSPDGHMVAFTAKADIKRPASSTYTDAERLEIYRNIFAGYAGLYRVEGNKVIHRIVASWRPDWIGADQVRYFELEGNVLTIRSAPIRSM
jgi:hypothetical protein